MKQDWISGEIDIPEFHCPRCRDHWYGIRSEPCDEELARLIREGLWKTGNAGKDLHQKGKHRGGSFTLTKSGDRDPLSTSSSGTKLPDLKHGQFHLKSNNSGTSNWEMRRSEESGKQKKKKRITFQLGEDESGSGSQLDIDQDERAGGRGRSGLGGERSRENEASDEVRGANGVGGAGGGGDRGRVTQGGGAGGGALGSSGMDVNGSMEEDSEAARARRRSNRTGAKGDQETAGNGSKVQGSLGDEDGGGKSARKERKGVGSDMERNLKSSELGRSGGGTKLDYGGNASGTGNSAGLGSEGAQTWSGAGGPGNSGGRGGEGEGGSGSSSRGSGSEGVSGGQQREGNEGVGLGTGEGDGTGQSGGQEDGNQRNKLSDQSGANKPPPTSGTGAGSNFTKPVDYGKRIRKSGGYMRAISPSSSEWGDPLHARSFISSTATSRMGSSSNLAAREGDETDHDLDTNGSGRKFLPPIVHPITHPPPTLQLDLMGPALTRAWTFSYH